MATKVTIITQYSYDGNDATGIDFDQNNPQSRSVTNQSDKDSTDINLALARYEKTGSIPDLLTGQLRKPIYGDFMGIGDYHQQQINIARANQAFECLPVNVRNRFQNDPAKLIEFLSDKNNDQEAIKLGLINAPKETTAELASAGQPANPVAKPGVPA